MEDRKNGEQELNSSDASHHQVHSPKDYRERFLWMGVTGLLVLLVGGLIFRNAHDQTELNRVHENEQTLIREAEALKESLTRAQEEKEKLTAEISALKGSLTPAHRNAQFPQSSSGLADWEIERLKEKGLQNPIQEIRANLLKHRELIPYKGVLGGQMNFYGESAIQILSPRWVLATFEDGHIAGQMLLEYQVSDSGQISWKVLDSYLED